MSEAMIIRRGGSGSSSGNQLQSKTVTPSTSQQTITPDSGYDGLSQVTVEAISPVKAAQTYTPGTSNQTIASGRWLTGAQTIKGDADLVAGNIKKGVNIFNVTGTYEMPSNDNALVIVSANSIISSVKFTGNGFSRTIPQSEAFTLTNGRMYIISIPPQNLGSVSIVGGAFSAQINVNIAGFAYSLQLGF